MGLEENNSGYVNPLYRHMGVTEIQSLWDRLERGMPLTIAQTAAVNEQKKYGLTDNPGGVPAGLVPHNNSDGKQVTTKLYRSKEGEYQERRWQVVDSNGNAFRARGLKNTETPIDSPGVGVKTSIQVPVNSKGIATDKVGMSKEQLARAADGTYNVGVKNTVTWDGNQYKLSTQIHDTIVFKDHHIQSIQSVPYESPNW